MDFSRRYSRHGGVLVALLGLVGLTLWQCDREGPTASGPQVGSVVLDVAVPEPGNEAAGPAKAVVAKGRLRLSGTQLKQDIEQEIPVQAGRLQGRVDGVPVGQVQVDLALLESSDAVVWEASTRVVVTPNATATATLKLNAVDDTPPQAAYTVGPEAGRTSTDFLFQAQVADRHDATESLEVRWDFDNDGRFDTDWSTTKEVHRSFGKPGTYRVALEARDKGGKVGASSSRTVQVQNTPPVANAGQDVTRNAGQPVQLDGKASADPDGSPLTYAWRQTAGPVVALEGQDTPSPRFLPKEPNTYGFALRVRDGELDSPEDEVVVTVIPVQSDNRPPAANAGSDQAVKVGAVVQLDGNGSSDPDGNPLTYRWSAPVGVVLSSATAARPTFTAAVAGTYQFTLVVNDGKVDSSPDEVAIAVEQPNRQPVADAGRDQTVDVGAAVQLDGNGSSDPDGNPLTHRWSAPVGVALSSATASRPTFAASVAGTYQFVLVVNDGKVDSNPDEVAVTVVQPSAGNRAPVANAGPDKAVSVGAVVQLGGNGSSDPDGNPLSYRWSAPVGVTLSSATTARPTFTANAVGTYQLTLVVNDGKVDSGPDEVVVTVKEAAPPGRTITESLPGGATMEFVWIESGTFVMGSPDTEPTRQASEGPQHQVTVSRGFYLGKYEVTQGQWKAVTGTQPWSGQGGAQDDPRRPATHVGGGQLKEFVHRLNQAAGDSLYRLPTEAEWEYACRAGTTTAWSFGDDVSQAGQYAWYDQNAWNAGEQYAHAVGTKRPNPWDLYDMHGNVYEWCQDWLAPYSRTNQVDPVGQETADRQLVMRGGDFSNAAQYTRSASRGGLGPGDRYAGAGVRLVRMAEPAGSVGSGTGNTAPVANGGPDQSVEVGTTVTLSGGSSRDADGDPVSYLWTAPSGGGWSSANAAQVLFEATEPGTYRFSLVVNDGLVYSAPDEVVVTVVQPGRGNRAPVANAGPDQTVDMGAVVQLDGTGSSDPDKDGLSFRWIAPGGVTLSSNAVARPTFTAGTAGTYQFTLVVNDGKADSPGDQVQVTMRDATHPIKTITETLPGGATMEFVWIEPGTFMMGTTEEQEQQLRAKDLWEEWFENEHPAHQVTISEGFWLGKREVTQVEWSSVMGSNPSMSLGGQRPVEEISWNDVQAYILELNQAVGEEVYRLPTEAEWEYACRAGNNALWSFGDELGQLNNYAWYDCGGNCAIMEVGQKEPNPWGLYDMYGNVWEWCQDWYGSYMGAAQTDPRGAASGTSRVNRGGVFYRTRKHLWSANRGFNVPGFRHDNIGARLLRSDRPTPLNASPQANAGPDQTMTTDSQVQLDATASSDPDGDPMSYRWTAPAGVTLSSSAEAQPTFTATAAGTYRFTLVVNDGKVDSQPDEVVITVVAPPSANRPPVANAGPDQTVDVNQSVQLDGRGSSDPDGDQLTFVWTQISGPSVGEGRTATPSFTPVQPGTYVFSLVVSDGELDSAPDEVVITVVAPAVQPRIVFASDRDGNAEIYVVDLDGRNPMRLTNNFDVDAEPRSSFDGQRIVFSSFRDGHYDFFGNLLSEVYVMGADGSSQVDLTRNEAAADAEATWSPDGGHIAFTTNRDGDQEIYVMGADGSAQTNLSQNPGLDGQAAWSPDGRRIAFASMRQLDAFGNPSELAEIYAMNADGGNQLTLTRNPAEDAQPCWSPDGGRIAFVSNRDGDYEVYVMNADGSNPVNLTLRPGAVDFRPSWSPDGKSIAFVSDRGGLNEIYIMGAGGGSVRKLVEGFGNADWPSWMVRGAGKVGDVQVIGATEEVGDVQVIGEANE